MDLTLVWLFSHVLQVTASKHKQLIHTHTYKCVHTSMCHMIIISIKIIENSPHDSRRYLLIKALVSCCYYGVLVLVAVIVAFWDAAVCLPALVAWFYYSKETASVPAVTTAHTHAHILFKVRLAGKKLDVSFNVLCIIWNLALKTNDLLLMFCCS